MPSFIQDCTPVNRTSVAPSPLSVTCSGVVAGHALVYGGVVSTTTGLSCTDSGGSSWDAVDTGPTGSGGVTGFVCFTTASVASGSVTINLNFTPNSFGIAFAQEWTGLTGRDSSVGTDIAAGTTWPMSAITTSASGDVIFTGAGSGSVNAVYTAGSGAVIGPNSQASGGGQSAFLMYHVVGAAGNYNETATVNSAITGEAATTAVFATGGGGGPTVPQLMTPNNIGSSLFVVNRPLVIGY